MFAFHYGDEFIAATFFFFVDLINQSLISGRDLFFSITTVSFRAGGPWAFCRFFFLFSEAAY